MTFAENMTALAGRMLTKFGETVTFSIDGTATRTGQTYTPPGSPDTSQLTVGVEPFTTEEIDGESVQRGDTRIWVRDEDLDFEMKEGLPLTRDADSTKFDVHDIEHYVVQGVTIAYRLHLRRRRK